MNKKTIITLIIISLILFVPIPTGVYKDGGTRAYSALTYKIVKWNRIIDEDYKYTQKSIYWIPNNFKTIDELWTIEKSHINDNF